MPEQEPDGIQLIRDSASGARTEVEATIEPGGAADTYTLRPDAPLAAEETYQLVVQGARGSGFSVGTYTIRGGIDTTPPTLGAIGVADYDPTVSYCGSKVSPVVKLQGATSSRASR